MNMRCAIAATTVLVATLFCTTVNAQEEATTTYMKFETFEVDDEIMSAFYKELQEAIEDHPEMQLVKGGRVTFGELILTIGCGTEEECLPELGDYVKARHMVYGSVQHTENIYLFTLKVHDFETGAELHPTTESTVQGSLDEVLDAIPTLIESALYGPVGKLEISGPEGAEVLLDGKKVGEVPYTSSTLPLGNHVVTIREPNGKEQKKDVFLQRDKPAKVTFETTVVAPPKPEQAPDFSIPAYVSFGLGALAIGYGVYSGVQLSSLEGEASTFKGRTSVSSTELEDIQRIEQANDAAYTGMVVGFSVGAIAVAAGTALLLLPSSEAAPEPTAIRWGITPTPDRVQLDVGWSF